MTGYREHCGECGAYLATTTDQNLHADWHDQISREIKDLARAVVTIDAWMRPIG